MAEQHYEWQTLTTLDHRHKDDIQYNPQRCELHPVKKGAAPLAFWRLSVAGITAYYVCSDCVEDLVAYARKEEE